MLPEHDGAHSGSLESGRIPRSYDIAGELAAVSHRFLAFYADRGYQVVPPAGIVPQEDTSVLFTGATITPLKKYLTAGVPAPGFTMVQKCLRTNHINDLTDVGIIPDWTCYFTMCGILAAPGRMDAVQEEAAAFLLENLGIPADRLLVEASSEDRDLSGYWLGRGVSVVEDSHELSFYRWKYGMPGVSGRGINLILRLDNRDQYRDLGNVIRLTGGDGGEIGFEFGFGLESLISKLHGFKRPMEASLVSAAIPYREGLQEKIVDALMAAVVILHSGVEPGRGTQQHVLKRLIKGISYIRRVNGTGIDELDRWARDFEQAEFGAAAHAGKLATEVSTYEQQVLKFDEYARNQIHAHTLRGEIVGDRVRAKLVKQGEILGVLPVEIERIIAGLMPSP